jgi:hypothetical protein
MEKAAGRDVRSLRRDSAGSAQANGAGISGELRSIVECLLAAHYSEHEILDYLTVPLGCSDADATAAVIAVNS